MRKIQLFAVVIILFLSCKDKEVIPEKIFQFSEKAIEKSIDIYPLKDFYNDTYFSENVSKEYLNRLNINAIVWRGMEHNTELREANLINQYGNSFEYLLKYWVTFKDNRKFSYSLNVLETNGKMTLNKFEPLNANIVTSFYSPNQKIDIPNFTSNRIKIYSAYILILVTLIVTIILTIRKRKYSLLLVTPLLFVYNKGMLIFNFEGIKTLSSKTYFGLPLFKNIDLHFTSISLVTTGVFFVWGIFGLYIILSIKKNKNTHYNTV